MAAFAFMLRRLLATGGARVGIRSMLATSFAANALSVSIPVAGPELATAFTFRRFTRQGADAPLAGWSLLAGGVVSVAAGALVLVGGGLASGSGLVSGFAVSGGVLAVAALLALGAAARGHSCVTGSNGQRPGRCGTWPGCDACRPRIPPRSSGPGLNGLARSTLRRPAG